MQDDAFKYGELIDLSSTNKQPTFPAYPSAEMGASGLVVDNQAIICGGTNGLSNKCYKYDVYENKWNWFCDLKTPRYRHAMTRFGKDSILITGKYLFCPTTSHCRFLVPDNTQKILTEI